MTITKKQQEILKFIETQINVKLEIREIKKQNYIPFEDNLKPDEMCRLNSLSGITKKFQIVSNGYQCLALIKY